MYVLRNLKTFLWWAFSIWLYFHDVPLLLCIALILLSAAPFAQWILQEDNGDAPPMNGLARYTLLHSVTALTVAKAAIYAGKMKAMSHREVMTREDES